MIVGQITSESQCTVDRNEYFKRVKLLTLMSDEELSYLVTNKNVKADIEVAHLFIPFEECNKKK